MKLTSRQQNTIKRLLSEIKGADACLEDGTVTIVKGCYRFVISHLDLLGSQIGIEAIIDLEKYLSSHSRNQKIENSKSQDFTFIKSTHLGSNKWIRCRSSALSVALVTTKGDQSLKTVLELPDAIIVYVGDHYDQVKNLLEQSPSRLLNEMFPEVYRHLLQVERRSHEN